MEITITPPQPFSFIATIYSHGWIDLPPFSYNEQTGRLDASLHLPDRCIKIYLNSNTDDDIQIQSKETLSDSDKEYVQSAIKKMFRLNDDFNSFYTTAAKYKKYDWIIRRKAGRMFRCQDLWEDMAKMLCTTNCTWNLTRIMVENLVNKLGNGCFPAPVAVAGQTEDFLRQEIKLGYRSPYLLNLSRKIVNREIDLNTFENWPGDTLSLYKELRKIKGFGHYAVSGLLKLLGHYSFMGSDSWSRKKFSELYGFDNHCSEDDIIRHYRHLGKWCGLFFWMDVTKDWYERKPFV